MRYSTTTARADRAQNAEWQRARVRFFSDLFAHVGESFEADEREERDEGAGENAAPNPARRAGSSP